MLAGNLDGEATWNLVYLKRSPDCWSRAIISGGLCCLSRVFLVVSRSVHLLIAGFISSALLGVETITRNFIQEVHVGALTSILSLNNTLAVELESLLAWKNSEFGVDGAKFSSAERRLILEEDIISRMCERAQNKRPQRLKIEAAGLLLMKHERLEVQRSVAYRIRAAFTSWSTEVSSASWRSRRWGR